MTETRNRKTKAECPLPSKMPQDDLSYIQTALRALKQFCKILPANCSPFLFGSRTRKNPILTKTAVGRSCPAPIRRLLKPGERWTGAELRRGGLFVTKGSAAHYMRGLRIATQPGAARPRSTINRQEKAS